MNSYQLVSEIWILEVLVWMVVIFALIRGQENLPVVVGKNGVKTGQEVESRTKPI